MPALIILLLLMADLPAAAQGFRSFSGRNHPEITWLEARTEHFVIVYPERLSGIEAEAAAIAEESYRALSANLQVEFDRPIRIYLSDEDEITNGFAVPIGTGFTNIWVHVNDVARSWTGEEKWLRKVIAHELAHIFHFRAVRSPIGLLQNVIAQPLPRFWAEGLAQYLTEDWDVHRGDRWLRTAALDGRLSYADGRSIWNGRLMYAIGNSQVRYFAEQHGDSTLAALHRHRRPALFGLTRVHDFDRAFRATIGKSHREFYDDWRRHINIYYHTLAGRLENVDSLGVPPARLPGQYIYDVAYARDTSQVAVLSLVSIAEPFRRIYLRRADGERRVLAEGAILEPLAWSPDGRRLAYTRTLRGRHGSLINDIVTMDVDARRERRLTRSRRASSPAFNPANGALTFVASDGPTANVFEIDLQTGSERRLTQFEGEVQIGSIRWSPTGEHLAIALFDADGSRGIHIYDADGGGVRPLVMDGYDNRDPVWDHDGTSLAFTSYREDVSNVFVIDLEQDTLRTATRLATGGRVHDWLPPDDEHAEGRLAVVTGVSKERDRAFLVDAARDAGPLQTEVPAEYAAWTEHRPPAEVPTRIAPDADLITTRGRYNSWRNITHAASVALPYYAGPDQWGIFGVTSFVEPLGMHAFAASAAVSFGDLPSSWLFASYINNQWHPTVAISAYRFPGSLQVYGDEFLAERLTGADVSFQLPIDLRQRPFTSIGLGLRTRYVAYQPLETGRFDVPDGPPAPRPGEQFDVQLELRRQRMRPYRHNVVHPLSGHGVRLRLTGAAPVLRSDHQFLEADLQAYHVLPSIGRHRLYVYGRAQAREGTGRPQDYLGLGRYDDVLIALPGQVAFEFGNRERVRGYNEIAIGDRVLFGSAEYRMPLLPDLQTRLFGLVSLGATTGALFVDAASVWSGTTYDDGDHRMGTGFELKNALRIGGLEITFSAGVARPVDRWDERDATELYYRVRAAVPF